MRDNNKYSILSSVLSPLKLDNLLNSSSLKSKRQLELVTSSKIKTKSKRAKRRVSIVNNVNKKKEEIDILYEETSILMKPSIYAFMKSYIYNTKNIILSHMIFTINFIMNLLNEVFISLFQEDSDIKYIEFKKNTIHTLKSNKRDIEELKNEISILKSRLDNKNDRISISPKLLSKPIGPSVCGPSCPPPLLLSGPPPFLLSGPPPPLMSGPPSAAFTTAPPLGLLMSEIGKVKAASILKPVVPQSAGISMSDILNVKLKKIEIKENDTDLVVTPTKNRNPGVPTLGDILAAQSQLKAVNRVKFNDKENLKNSGNKKGCNGLINLKDITNTKANLRKSEAKTSPGGTPFKKSKSHSSPANEILRAALFNKLKAANILSPLKGTPIRG